MYMYILYYRDAVSLSLSLCASLRHCAVSETMRLQRRSPHLDIVGKPPLNCSRERCVSYLADEAREVRVICAQRGELEATLPPPGDG